MRRPRVSPLLVLLLFLGATRSAEPPAPMHNEDVVRMLVSGKPASAIVEAIHKAPAVDFDVSPEMLTELRSVSLPEQVIDAMKARMLELERVKATEERVQDITSGPKLRVHFSGTTTLHFPDWGTAAVGEKMKLDLRNEKDREIRDVAFFLACTSELDVPDQWRSKSPLGRDFTVPKHQMLFFQPGAAHLSASDVATGLPDAFRRTRDDGTAAGWYEVTLPAEIAVEVNTNEAHDLLLGIALDVQGNWHPLVTAKRKGVEVGTAGTELYATVTGKPESFDLTLTLSDKAGP